MLRTRRALNIVVPVYMAALVGSWLVRGLLSVGLDLPFGWRLGLVLGFAVAGLAVALENARELGPWTEREVRDGARGWGFVGAIIAALPCFLLPPPWSFAAAVAAVTAVVAVATAFYRAAPRLREAGVLVGGGEPPASGEAPAA